MPKSSIPRPAAAGAKAARFRTDAGISLAGALFARSVVFILQVLIARGLGVAELNEFVTASIVGATIHLVSDLGLRPASLFIARGDPEICGSVVARYRTIRWASGLAGLVVGAAAVVVLTGGGWASMTTAGLLVGSYVVQSYSRYLRAPLRAASRVGTETRVEVAEKATMLTGGVVGLALDSFEVLAAGQLLGALVGLSVTRWRVAGYRAREIRLKGSVVRYGVTLAVAIGAPMLYSRLDYLVLVRIGTEFESAVYAASYSLLLAGSLIPMALSEAAIAHLGDGRAGWQRYLRFTFVAGIAGGAVIAVLGPEIVRRLFGFQHTRMEELFVVLGLAFMVMTWNSTIGVLAPLGGQQKLLLKIVASAAVVCLMVCLVLVRVAGMVGAGLSTLFTELYVGAAWLTVTRGRSSRSLDSAPASEVPIVTLLP